MYLMQEDDILVYEMILAKLRQKKLELDSQLAKNHEAKVRGAEREYP